MTTLLERAHEAEATSKAEAARAYDDLVAAAVAGTDDVALDPAPILRAAGKTANDFSGAVNCKRSRREAQQRITKVKADSKRHTEIMASIEASAAKLREAEQRHLEHCRPLHIELHAIGQRQLAAMDDERLLRETASPELKREAQAIQSRLAASGERLTRIRDTIQRLTSAKSRAARAVTYDDRHSMLQLDRNGEPIGSGNAGHVASIQQQLDAATKELKSAEQQNADLLRQRDEIDRQHLES